MQATINSPTKYQNAEQTKGRQRPLSKKNKFTREEDEKLKSLIEEFGTQEWAKIAALIPGRTSRQCRDRWSNYIDPKISTKPWTSTEDMELLKRYAEIGSHWRILANCFPGRSINNVRNRVVKLMKQTQDYCSDPSLLGSPCQQPYTYPTQQAIVQSSPEEETQKSYIPLEAQKEKNDESISQNSSPLADFTPFSNYFFDIFGNQSSPDLHTSFFDENSFHLLFE